MILADLAEGLLAAVAGFLVLGAIFRPLELAYPARRAQPFARPGWRTDLCFFLGQYLVWVTLVFVVLGELTPWLHGLVPPGVRRVFCLQPLPLQLVEVVVLGDFCIYWAHRLQHRVDFLWRFHAVHHSAERLDWLAAHREHPVDTIYSVTLMNLPAFLIGFSPEAMAGITSFRGLWSIFIHSNVRARLGWLGRVFGSPELHHWHHARDRRGVNFGNVCPYLDLLFGTHFDPGVLPEELGLEEPIGEGYAELMLGPLVPDVPGPAGEEGEALGAPVG